MGSAAQNILRLLQKVRSIMKTLVLVLVLSVASGSPVLMDTLEVAAEKEKFAAAFKAAEAGEHAKLAPVNTDVQEPAPVFVGRQIPEAFLEDTAPVAEARSLFTAAFEDAAAGGLAAKQAPAPEFTGEQIADSYLEDFAPVAEARAACKAGTITCLTCYPCSSCCPCCSCQVCSCHSIGCCFCCWCTSCLHPPLPLHLPYCDSSQGGVLHWPHPPPCPASHLHPHPSLCWLLSPHSSCQGSSGL